MKTKELTTIRIFDAPIETLWSAWTDGEMMSKWWSPEGFTVPVSRVDAKEGGEIYIEMEDDAGFIKKGGRYPMRGLFKELTRPKRIVIKSDALLGDKPIIESLVTVDFVEVGDKTKMNLHVVVTNSTPEAKMPLEGMDEGWKQSIDKLQKLVEG